MHSATFTFRSETDKLTIKSHATMELEALAQLAWDLEKLHGLPASTAKNFTLVKS